MKPYEIKQKDVFKTAEPHSRLSGGGSRKRIFDYVSSHPVAYLSEIARGVGLDEKSAERHLEILVYHKYIVERSVAFGKNRRRSYFTPEYRAAWRGVKYLFSEKSSDLILEEMPPYWKDLEAAATKISTDEKRMDENKFAALREIFVNPGVSLEDLPKARGLEHVRADVNSLIDMGLVVTEKDEGGARLYPFYHFKK